MFYLNDLLLIAISDAAPTLVYLADYACRIAALALLFAEIRDRAWLSLSLRYELRARLRLATDVGVLIGALVLSHAILALPLFGLWLHAPPA